MEADELMRAVEFEFREFTEETCDERCVVCIEAAFGSFELRKEMVKLVGSERHGERDSVTHFKALQMDGSRQSGVNR